MSVSWQKVQIPLAAGIQNRVNDQALEPPSLEVCRNAEFDELGGIRKRRANNTIGQDPSGAADVRRLIPYGNELVIMTSDGVYTWEETNQETILRDTYLAATVEESSRYTRTTEQPYCDRAEAVGVVVLAWRDAVSSVATVKVAAYEKATGITLVERTFASPAIYPRLIATDNRILFVWVETSGVKALAINPDSPTDLATSLDAAPTTIDSNVSVALPALDGVKQTSTTAVITYRSSTGTMRARTINESAAVTQSLNSGRTVSSCTAVAVAPGGGVLVVRDNTTNVEADLLTSALVDSTINIAVGTGTTQIDQIAAAFKSTQDSGQYRCHIVWSSNEQTSPTSSNFECKTNYVDDAGTAGTQGVLANRLGVASRAFEYTATSGTSRVLVWLTFGVGSTTGGVTFSQLQNTYLLYDVDGGIHAKAVPGTGGGLAQFRGILPGVQSLGSNQYGASLIERRVISLDGGDTDFAQRSPREVVITFDDDAARRTAQLGATLYLAGAQVSQYDGVAVHEVGFAIAPYYIDAQHIGGGSIADGDYTYRVSASWENAKGELERSTSIGSDDHTMNSAGSLAQITTNPVHATTKTDPDCAYEIWRTAVDPVLDSPAYLVTSKDPTSSGTNGYLENDPTTGDFSTFSDDLVDGPLASPAGAAYLVKNETFPENGGVLATIAPPSATIIAADQDRLYLAGIAGRPYRVAYSKLRGNGELAQFNDGLFVDVPSASGIVTALSFVNNTLIAFCERGIYALVGAGFDNLGGGQNFAPRLVSSDVGAVNADAVAVTPQGVIFLSGKGWHLLDRGLSVRYIGAPVSDFDAYTFTNVSVSESQHQIRCFGYSGADGVALVFDTVADAWSEWQFADGIHACMYRGDYVVVTNATSTITRQESAHGTGDYTSYSLDLETAWIKLDGLQGFRRIRRLLVLGEYRGAHRLRVRIAYDYDSSWVDDFYWTVSPTDVGEPEQVETRPSRPKGQAIKIRITDRHTSTDTPPVGDSVKLSGLALELGVKRGTYRALPAAQKQ